MHINFVIFNKFSLLISDKMYPVKGYLINFFLEEKNEISKLRFENIKSVIILNTIRT